MTNTEYDEWVGRQLDQYGHQWTPPTNGQILYPYLKSGKRIEVNADGLITRGFVSVITGQAPMFVLARTIRSDNNGIVLDGNVEVLGEMSY